MSILGGWGDIEPPKDPKEDLKKGWGYLLGATGLIGLPILHEKLSWSMEGTGGMLSYLEKLENSVVSATTTGLTVSGAAATAYGAFKAWQTLRKEEMTAFRLIPKTTTKVDPERVAGMVKEFRQMYSGLFGKRSWLRWQIIRDQNEMFEFRLILPKRNAKVVKTRLGNAYPDCVIAETVPGIPDFFDPLAGESAHVKLSRRGKQYGLDGSLSNHMGDILSLMERSSILEITFSPSSIKDIRKTSKNVIDRLEERQRKGKDVTATIEAIRQRYADGRTAFDVFIDVWGLYGVEALIGELSAKTEGRLNKLKGRPYGYFEEYRNTFNWNRSYRPLAFWQGSKLTDKEIAPLFMLPAEGHPIWQSIKCEFPRPKVTDKDFQGVIGIGYIDSEDPQQNGRPARLNIDTLTNHGLIAGGSGGGKGSTLMMLMKMDFFTQWIENKPNSLGMTLCDPHTEDITLILSHLLDLEEQGIEIPWDRVKVVSFGDLGAMKYPVAANLLHVPKDGNLDRVARNTSETILAAYESSNLSESASKLQTAIQGLLHMQRKTSLLDIVRLFEYSEEGARLRKEAIAGLTGRNDVIAIDWKKIDQEIQDLEKDKKVAAIQTRLSPLISMKSLQRFFCREDNFFSQIPQFMENGDLVLIDFKGADQEIFRLCTSWLATQYYNDSQARGTGKRPHLLVFDECQKFQATEPFFRILTENRKFGLGLLLMTQAVEALDDTLKGAIKTNAGFIISVRQDDGAKDMAYLLGEPFEVNELKGLQKGREACIRSFEGKARLKLDYPAYPWKGEATTRGSEEEQKAKTRAKGKMIELLARDHKTAEEADQEIQQFVYGSSLTLVETAATEEKTTQSQSTSKKREVAKLKVVRKL